MAGQRAYCTYFDSGYLSRGLALIESLREHGDRSPVWVMALDDAAADHLRAAALPDVHVVSAADLEADNPALAALRAQRKRMEFYFTCTPLLVRWVMDHSDGPTSVAYVDGDLFYFADPGAVWDALGDDSVGIIEHRYPPAVGRRLAKYGRFNVGWVGFAPDERGRAVLRWWGERTIEWCSDTPEDGKYADQGYLDRFPDFPGVRILGSAGFDLAPWNTRRHDVSETGGRVFADGDPLVFFHFHGVRRTRRWWISAQLLYRAAMTRVLRQDVYTPYVRTLERLEAGLPATRLAPRGTGLRGFAFRTQRRLLDAASVVAGAAIRAQG